MNNVNFFTKAKMLIKYRQTFLNLLRAKANRQKVFSFPILINLFVTNRCNLNCPMCLNAQYRQGNIGARDMSLDLVKRIIPELKIHKPVVNIAGGEPFLHKNIFDIIRLFSQEKIFTTTTTNGFLVENYVDNIISAGLEFISFSLDHFEESNHDQGRGVSGSYKHLLSGLSSLLKQRRTTPANIKINTVIRKDNFHCLSKMYDFIENLGVDEWSLQHYSFLTARAKESVDKYKKDQGIGNYTEGVLIAADHYFNKDEVTILSQELASVERKSRRYKTKLSIKPEINNLFLYYSGQAPSFFSSCNTPFTTLNITDYSKVNLCMGYEIGDLEKEQDKSLLAIWQSAKAKNFQKLVAKNKVLPPCFRCCALNYIF